MAFMKIFNKIICAGSAICLMLGSHLTWAESSEHLTTLVRSYSEPILAPEPRIVPRRHHHRHRCWHRRHYSHSSPIYPSQSGSTPIYGGRSGSSAIY